MFFVGFGEAPAVSAGELFGDPKSVFLVLMGYPLLLVLKHWYKPDLLIFQCLLQFPDLFGEKIEDAGVIFGENVFLGQLMIVHGYSCCMIEGSEMVYQS